VLPAKSRQPGLVSVIVPVYNRPAQLRTAVESVLSQDYRPVEIIIVDDGSDDGLTPSAAEAIAAAASGQVRIIRIPNSGPGCAREQGRLAARGEFIQYLDSDDILLPGKFRVQVAALRAHPEANVAYGVTLLRDAQGQLVPGPHKDTAIQREHMFPFFLNSRWWETATPLYRAAVCALAGPWTNLRLEEDWEYDCRIASVGGTLVHCAVPVSEMRDHSGPRLSRGSAHDVARLAMRATAHRLVWRHAKKAGLPANCPSEVSRFARSLFLLARQCGANGLTKEARELHADALEAASTDSDVLLQLRTYKVATRVFGWRLPGRLAQLLDVVRDRMRPVSGG
jgi:hypothetical protein